MTLRDDIIRLAQESGLKDLCGLETTGWPGDARVDALIDFAVLVAAAEREACAKVCVEIEKRKWQAVMHGGAMQGIGARDCAAAIRDRGENK
jgi:hypothetical protein